MEIFEGCGMCIFHHYWGLMSSQFRFEIFIICCLILPQGSMLGGSDVLWRHQCTLCTAAQMLRQTDAGSSKRVKCVPKMHGCFTGALKDPLMGCYYRSGHWPFPLARFSAESVCRAIATFSFSEHKALKQRFSSSCIIWFSKLHASGCFLCLQLHRVGCSDVSSADSFLVWAPAG